MTGTRIAVPDEEGVGRQLLKIVGLADGGFAVTVPYHSAREGFLFKFPVDYSKQRLEVAVSDVVRYTASDRVKLSLHLDGFVQFSGEQSGRITSGRHDDGTPKGLGLLVNPLTAPLATGGPTFGVLAWGLRHFEGVKPNRKVMTFDEGLIYYRDCAAGDWNGYLVEGFVYPRRFLGRATVRAGRLVLERVFPNYEEIPRESGLILPTRQPLFEQGGAIFGLTLIDTDGPMIIGLLVSRVHQNMGSETGFQLSSPSNMEHALMAVYPSPFGDDASAASLDYGGRGR